jgi:hypothetical protein
MSQENNQQSLVSLDQMGDKSALEKIDTLISWAKSVETFMQNVKTSQDNLLALMQKSQSHLVNEANQSIQSISNQLNAVSQVATSVSDVLGALMAELDAKGLVSSSSVESRFSSLKNARKEQIEKDLLDSKTVTEGDEIVPDSIAVLLIVESNRREHAIIANLSQEDQQLLLGKKVGDFVDFPKSPNDRSDTEKIQVLRVLNPVTSNQVGE